MTQIGTVSRPLRVAIIGSGGRHDACMDFHDCGYIHLSIIYEGRCPITPDPTAAAARSIAGESQYG